MDRFEAKRIKFQKHRSHPERKKNSPLVKKESNTTEFVEQKYSITKVIQVSDGM